MKGIKILLLLLAVSAPPGILARGVASVVDSLAAVRSERIAATFTVAMPQLPEDVTYSLDMTTVPGADTTLFPCSYLIDWTIESTDNPVHGFSAYFNGHHYRFAGEKLQEYHAEADSVPFLPSRFGASSSQGVQHSAQFVNLLPVSIASALRTMLTDSAYTVTFNADTIVSGSPAAAIRATLTTGGQIAMESEYILDPTTYAPRGIHFENSPGSVSEQTVDVVYTSITPLPASTALTEPVLIERYPEPFTRMRQSSFTLENLVGSPLPAFTAPTPTGERYSRQKGDPFAAVTILAIIDPSASFAPELVADLRSAVASAPAAVNLIMAFTTTNSDLIEEVAGTPAPGETILQSAKGLARDLGAASLPSMLIIDTDSTVRDIIVGFNKEIASGVIQKIALL